MASVKITETANLEKILAELPIALRGKALKAIVKKSVAPTAKEMRRRAPVETPNLNRPQDKPLKKTIITKIKEYRQGGMVMAIVGPSHQEGRHGHLLEAGHKIVPRGQAKGGTSNRGGNQVGEVDAKPWMAPAVDTTQKAVDTITIRAIVEKLKAKGG